MSASEKLKALEENAGGFHDPLVVARLRSALPQIVAVVEAAEAFNFPAIRGDAWRNLSAALSALDEALS